MKKTILLFAVFILFSFLNSNQIYSQTTKDTTVSAKLYQGNEVEVTLSCTMTSWDGDDFASNDYTIIIDGKKYYREAEFMGQMPVLMVVTIDNQSEFMEAVVKREFYYYSYYDVYRYDGNNISFLGEIPTLTEVVFSGDRTMIAPQWMGFWELTGDYELIGESIVPVVKEEYYPKLYADDLEIKVTEEFKLHGAKDESSISITANPGDVILVKKADIRDYCEEEEIYGPFNGSNCNWYYIETTEGKGGWVRLKDFMDKVDFLPWAG